MADPSGSEAAGRYDRAVLFVHGIGQPAAGATVQRFGLPFAEYAAARAGGPKTRLEPVADGWRLTLDDGERVRRWLLIELRWADLVPPAPYSRLLAWLLLAAPWILHSDALSWSSRRPARPPPSAAKRLWRITIRWWAFDVYRLLWAVARSMSLLALGLIAQVVLTVIGLLGLLPVLRPAVRKLQRALTRTVGDSFVFVHDDLTWSRIEDRLIRAVAAGASRADRLVVLTHSQGTAVMHRALTGVAMDGRVSTWLSLGSGLQKLAELNRVGTRSLIAWATVRLIAVAAIAATVPGWERVVNPGTGEAEVSSPLGAAVLVALVLLYAPLAQVRRVRRGVADRVASAAATSRLRWVDLYTRYDPVPAGPLPGASADWRTNPVSVEVHNLGSYLHDHSAYAGNHEEVNATLFDVLADRRPPSVSGPAATLRRDRVALRRPLWLLTAGMTLAATSGVVRVLPTVPAALTGFAVAAAVSALVVQRPWLRWNETAARAALLGLPDAVRFGRGALGLTIGWAMTTFVAGLAGVEAGGGTRSTVAAFAVAAIVVGAGWSAGLGAAGRLRSRRAARGGRLPGGAIP